MNGDQKKSAGTLPPRPIIRYKKQETRPMVPKPRKFAESPSNDVMLAFAIQALEQRLDKDNKTDCGVMSQMQIKDKELIEERDYLLLKKKNKE